MLDDVDDCLSALLADLGRPPAAIVFDPPSPDWRPERPTLDLFLAEIREDPAGTESDWREIRDERGHVVARTPPVRRFRLLYLVTAWAQRARTEREVLSAALRMLAARPAVPGALLPDGLREAGHPVLIELAGAAATDRLADLWAGLGVPPRAGFALTVSAPLRGASEHVLSPAPRRVEVRETLEAGRRTIRVPGRSPRSPDAR